MPQKTFSNWLGGLTPYSQNIGQEGSYAEARDIDPHRDPGFIKPGWKETSSISSSAGVLHNLIVDAAGRPDASTLYALDASHLYQLSGTTFRSDGTFPHAVSATAAGRTLTPYYVSGTSYLIYTMATDIGAYDYATTFVDSYLQGTLSGAALTDGVPHPVHVWAGDGIMYVGNDRYLSSLDGALTGVAATWTEDALDLGIGWRITSLFPTQNYIGICASKGTSYTTRRESAVFFWDSVSEKPNYRIPIEDNIIYASYNDSGRTYLVTEGRGNGSVLRRLTSEGDDPVTHLKTYVDGSLGYSYVRYPNAIDIHQNRILIGAGDLANNIGNIFTYGSPNPLFPEKVLAQPYSSSVSAEDIGCVKQLSTNTIYASFGMGSTYYWKTFSLGYSDKAVLKEKYFEPGRKVRVNWVKFYFKAIAANANVTVGLDTDYGTANALDDRRGNTTISYTNDGAVTSKKFYSKVDCYAFRPTIDYTSNPTNVEVAFSRIVVDYSIISDV